MVDLSANTPTSCSMVSDHAHAIQARRSLGSALASDATTEFLCISPQRGYHVDIIVRLNTGQELPHGEADDLRLGNSLSYIRSLRVTDRTFNLAQGEWPVVSAMIVCQW
jgi:hypothetical protein